jgi:hypothetical protein
MRPPTEAASAEIVLKRIRKLDWTDTVNGATVVVTMAIYYLTVGLV